MKFLHIHARVFSSGNEKDEIIKLTAKDVNTLEDLKYFCDSFAGEMFMSLVNYFGLNEELRERGERSKVK